MNQFQFNTVHLACDHAGFAYKESVRVWLKSINLAVVDHGAYEFNVEDDFNEFVKDAVESMVNADVRHCAVIFGGSGQGEAMMANRVSGARAGVYYGGNLDVVRLSRQHNNTNVLSLGARFLSLAEVKESIEVWLIEASWSEEKYTRRNNKLDSY